MYESILEAPPGPVPADKPKDPWSFDSLSSLIGGVVGGVVGGVLGFILGGRREKKKEEKD